MGEFVVDPGTNRSFYLDYPSQISAGQRLTFILSLHGGGGVWYRQRDYFPAAALAETYSLVIATPQSASARWVSELEDEHLEHVVRLVETRFGDHDLAFWLAGHSQGGLTCNRLLRTPFFAERVDGWLSLSGSRLGPEELSAGVLALFPSGALPPGVTPPSRLPDTDISFIYAVGSHEIASLPESSPLAERYGAGPKKRLPDVVDDQPGNVYQELQRFDSPAWGTTPRPGVAQVYVYPNARDGRVIADVVRLDKGHTEGLEPNITEAIVQLMVSAPSGKFTSMRERGS